MNLSWLDPENLGTRDLAGAVATLDAARELDYPHEAMPTVTAFAATLRHGWDGDAPVTALARNKDDRVIGVLQVHLPTWDNRHLGYLEVTVDPTARRQGIGSELFEAGVEKVRAEGRRVVLGGSFEASPGVAFLEAMGLERGIRDVKRRQDLLSVDRAWVDREYEAARATAEAYELLRIAGPTPDDMRADLAALTAAINDAPTDDLDVEDEVFSAARVEAFEASQRAHGLRPYRVIARERGAGGLAGNTAVSVEAEQPGRGHQLDTSVQRAHRGHRLGMLLKLDMLRWLGIEEPQLRFIDTWNAASNEHMIGVNEELGYRILAEAAEWQRQL